MDHDLAGEPGRLTRQVETGTSAARRCRLPAVTSDMMNPQVGPRAVWRNRTLRLPRTSCTAKTSKCETISAISEREESRIGESSGRPPTSR